MIYGLFTPEARQNLVFGGAVVVARN